MGSALSRRPFFHGNFIAEFCIKTALFRAKTRRFSVKKRRFSVKTV
jgi:hypothetical protein